MNDSVDSGALRFDRFVLDLRRGCLLAGGNEVELRPKTFKVLCYLIDNAGRLVTKEELFEVVWPDVIVSDDSIAQCIYELRCKFDDDDHTLIKTVSRRGYLLDAVVSAGAPEQPRDYSAGVPSALPSTPINALQAVRAMWKHKRLASTALAAALLCVSLGATYLAGWWATLPKLQQPETVDQFDGFWRVEFSNNEHCAVRNSVRIWAIRESTVFADVNGKRIGTVSNVGELRYEVAALIDPKLMNVGMASLRGERGEGKWEGQEGCGGVFTLVRTKHRRLNDSR